MPKQLKNIHSDALNMASREVCSLLESLPDAAFIMKPDGRVLNANSMFAEKFGMRSSEFIGADIYDLFVNILRIPQLVQYLREKSQQVLQSGKRLIFEDDTEIWKVAINPIRASGDKIESLYIVIQNIAEQKRTDKTLKTEHEIKSTLLDSITCSAIILDANLKLIAWNRYAHDLLFSTSSAEKPVVDPVDFFSPEDMASLRKKFLNTLETGIDDLSEVEVRPRGKAGSQWLFTRSKRIYVDGEPCLVSIGIDITERKLLEQELIESKIRYSYALDASHAGIWEWDLATDDLSWSEQVWKLYGLDVTSRPLNHQLCVDTIHPEDREMAARIIKEAVGAQNAASVEYRTCHPDGSIHWLTSRGMPILDDSGKVTRYIGAIIDITERKQIELELIENRKRLSQALEAARAGVWEWDLLSDENIWSDEIWPLYGLKPGDAHHPSFRLWSDSIHPDDRELAIRKVTEAAKNHTELNVEYRVGYPDGSVHWLMSRGKPVQDEYGSTIRYLGTIIDITERKKAEEALQESKVRFNFALKATGAGIWQWDVREDKVTWSEQIWALYGLEPNSIVPSHRLCESNVHRDDRELTFEQVMSAANRNIEFTVEYRVCHPDGSEHWLMCRGVPMPGADGKTTCYLGMVMDITERRQAEEERRRSQEKLNFVLQKSRLGVWDLDLDDFTALRSLEYARIFGYDHIASEWSLEHFYCHVVPRDRERIEQLINDAIDKQESFTFECQIITVSGNLRWIWLFGAFDTSRSGKAKYLSGVVQDITERKQTELLLKDSEQKFRNIFEFSPIAIGIEDMENERLFDVNASWLRLFGFSREEVIGKRSTELGLYQHPEDHDQIAQDLREHGRVFNRPFKLQKKSGDRVNVLYSAEYVTMNAQTSLLVMITDITIQELQQASISMLEKAVAERTAQLELEVEHLHRFLSMISHEYRTPLAIIRGNLDLIDLKHKSGDYSNNREMGKIKRAIDRLVEVMEVSIQESRILESQKTLSSTNFEIEPLVVSQLDAFRSMWPEREFRYSGSLGESRIAGESSLLKMAIFNLLDNALKYSLPDTPIEMSCRVEEHEAVIAIRNQGKSIIADEGEAFFEKYRRGSNAANTGGAGIGLWLVKSIIDQHHGQVHLTGTETGVEAAVRLPLAE